MITELSIEQKKQLYRDGFVILRGAVPADLVDRARKRIKAANRSENLGKTPEMLDLLNRSSLTPVLKEAMGEFDPVTACHVFPRPRSKPSEMYTALGYKDKDVPYYATELHQEGSTYMMPVQERQEGTPEEIYTRWVNSGPKGKLGRSAEVIGDNISPLFQDPEMTLGLGGFTAFAFVALNDQTKPGCGQTALLKGGHHLMEKFFREQRAINNCLGPEGPNWPRLNYEVPTRCGLNYLPPSIIEQTTDSSSECTPDGKRWPKPTFALLDAGDACITLHTVPHTGSRNENGSESRKNIIFRIRNKSRQPDHYTTGGSDHPDRGMFGEWLEYEEGNNPWERTKDAFCDIWKEWEGMREVVAEEKAKDAAQP